MAKFVQSRRIAGVGVSEILRIGETARRLKRQGHSVIVLAAGEPDFDTPDNVKEAAFRAIRDGQTKYTALDGTPELKHAIIDKFSRENGLAYRPDEVMAAAGAKQLIYNAFMASLDEGDEVVLAAPYWTSYADIVTVAGGRPVVIAGRESNGFRLLADELEAAITPATRWLLLNSPSNPSGAAYSRHDLVPLLEVLCRHPHVWLMADDIYEHLLYDGRDFVTPAQIAPSLKDRTLTINGVSKAYAMTGWRLGFAGGPSELIAAMAVVQSQSTSNPCSVSQAAAVEALSGPQHVLAGRRADFQKRRDFVVEALNAIPGIGCRRPEGAFYAFANCAGMIGRRTPDGEIIESDADFCRYLLETRHVAVVPGVCFGASPYFRVSYATSQAELAEAMERIRQAVEVLL